MQSQLLYIHIIYPIDGLVNFRAFSQGLRDAFPRKQKERACHGGVISTRGSIPIVTRLSEALSSPVI